MLKSCGRCGRMHEYNAPCPIPRKTPKITPDQKLRSHRRWTNKSLEIREASKWLCAICLEEGRYNYNDLEIHHITKLKDDEEGLLDNYNLICLCKHHHELADAGKIDANHLRELARRRENPEVPPGGEERSPS